MVKAHDSHMKELNEASREQVAIRAKVDILLKEKQVVEVILGQVKQRYY